MINRWNIWRVCNQANIDHPSDNSWKDSISLNKDSGLITIFSTEKASDNFEGVVYSLYPSVDKSAFEVPITRKGK